VEISRVFVPCLLSPLERVLRPSSLFIVLRGVAAQKGVVLPSGSACNIDFILSSPRLRDNAVWVALGFGEMISLEMADMDSVINRCPIADRIRVRKYAVQLAVKRGFLKVARAVAKARAKEVQNSRGGRAPPRGSGSLSMSSSAPETTPMGEEELLHGEYLAGEEEGEDDDIVAESRERPVDLPSVAKQVSFVAEQQRGHAVALAGLGASVQRIERALQLLLHQGLRRESAQIAGNPNLEAGTPPRIRGSLPLALMSPAAQSGAVPSPRDGSVSTQQQVPMASKTDASIQTEV
jgi:hypothetical protein